MTLKARVASAYTLTDATLTDSDGDTTPVKQYSQSAAQAVQSDLATVADLLTNLTTEQISATIIPDLVDVFETAGKTTVGDGAGGRFKRVPAAATYVLTSQDGAFFAPLRDRDGYYRLSQFPRGSAETNDTARVLRLFAAATALSANIRLDESFTLSPQAASDVPRLPSNTTLYASEGVVCTFGMQDVYYPAFASIDAENSHIKGNLKFVWTGALTHSGTNFDFVGPNDDSGEDSFDLEDTANRFGVTGNLPRTRHYCSAVMLYNTTKCSIRGLSCSSQAANSTSVIHNWVATLGGTDGLIMDDCEFSDCVIGALVQGGTGDFYFNNLRGNRMCQDVGIPGHLLYGFSQGNVLVTNIADSGLETTTVTDRIIHHSVYWAAGFGRCVIRGVASQRAAGPVNCKSNSQSPVVISGINWRYPDGVTYPTARNGGGALRCVSGTGAYGFIVDNCSLDIRDTDMIAIQGQAKLCKVKASVKCDSTAGGHENYLIEWKEQFATNRGITEVELNVVEEGNASNVRKLWSANGRQASNGLYKFRLQNWSNNSYEIDVSPVWDATNSAWVQSAVSNTFWIIDHNNSRDYLGTPEETLAISDDPVGGVVPDASKRAARGFNFVKFGEEGLTPWQFNSAAASDLSHEIPMREGVNRVTVAVRDTEAGSWKAETFEVVISRYQNSGAFVLTATSVLAARGTNTSNFGAFSLTPDGEKYVTLAIPIPDLTVQSHATETRVETAWLGQH